MGGNVKVVIDLETIALPVSRGDYEKWENRWEEEYKGAPSNWKDPEKIAAHKQESKVKAEKEFLSERKFRVGGNQIVAVGLGVVNDTSIMHLESFVGPDPNELMALTVGYLREVGRYSFVGFNVEGFDLPILNLAMHKAGLRLPCKIGKWDTLDLCERPFKRRYKLKDLADIYGLERVEGDGSGVQALWDEQNLDAIKNYNLSDVKITAELYQILARFYDI